MSVLAHNNKIIIAPNRKALNMQSYIDLANVATGETDTTLLNALNSLIDPYADINTAINAKGVSGTFLPSEMAAAIAAIPAGGGLPFKTGKIALSNSQQIGITHNLNSLKIIVFFWADSGTILSTSAVRTCYGLYMSHMSNIISNYHQYLSDGITETSAANKPFYVGAQMGANTTSTSLGIAYTSNAVTFPSAQTVNYIALKNTAARWDGTFNWIAIDISGGVS